MRLVPDRRLPDGSYLSTIYPSERDRRHRTGGLTVRAIDYRLEGVVGAELVYRLLTTILDHDVAPAHELAALYHERWEIETALDELKTHLRGARIVLRSKTPDLVRQEFYGLMMAHFAIPKPDPRSGAESRRGPGPALLPSRRACGASKAARRHSHPPSEEQSLP